MNPGWPAAAAYNPETLHAALRTQSRAASAMAVYLIGGSALIATALVIAVYRGTLPESVPQLPMLAVAFTLAWWLLGGFLMHHLQTRAAASHSAYEAYLKQLAHVRQQPTGWQKICHLLNTAPASSLATTHYHLPLSLFGAYLSTTPQQLQKL